MKLNKDDKIEINKLKKLIKMIKLMNSDLNKFVKINLINI